MDIPAAFENMRVNPFVSAKSKTVAFVSCKINTPLGGLYLNNMTLINGTKGLFLSFPSRKLPKPDPKGNEYQNHYFMSRELKEPIQAHAIKMYDEAHKASDANKGAREGYNGENYGQGGGGYAG